jgi:hypothetical protein
MTEPAIPSDTKSRALRTAAQNLGFDLALAIILVAQPAFSGDLASVNWGLLGASLLKTVVVTFLAAAQRYVETNRAG